LSAAGLAATASGWELARGPSQAFPLRVPVLRMAIALAPVTAFAALLAGRRDALAWTLAGAALVCALAGLPRAAASFSLPNVLASIACFASAAALACGPCPKNA
jgi:hypothetical protein